MALFCQADDDGDDHCVSEWAVVAHCFPTVRSYMHSV